MENYLHPQFETIEAYLKGSLAPEEKILFEIQMDEDPILRSEVEFQRDVITALQETRVAALKSRLNEVPLHTPILQRPHTWGIAAVLSSILMFGGYFYYQEIVNPTIVAPRVKLDREPAQYMPDHSRPAVPARPEPPFTAKVQPAEEVNQVDTGSPTVNGAANDKPVTQGAVAGAPAEQYNTGQLPDIQRPDVVTRFDDQFTSLDDTYAETPVFNSNDAQQSLQVQVTEPTPSQKDNKRYYQYFDDKLYLIGNFNDAPYEVLALNTSKSRKLYLYYSNTYYALEPTREIETLRVINDSVSIQSLQKLRALDQ